MIYHSKVDNQVNNVNNHVNATALKKPDIVGGKSIDYKYSIPGRNIKQ